MTIVMVLLPEALVPHTALALQGVIDDYGPAPGKVAALTIMRLSCLGLSVAGIMATLHVAVRWLRGNGCVAGPIGSHIDRRPRPCSSSDCCLRRVKGS